MRGDGRARRDGSEGHATTSTAMSAGPDGPDRADHAAGDEHRAARPGQREQRDRADDADRRGRRDPSAARDEADADEQRRHADERQRRAPRDDDLADCHACRWPTVPTARRRTPITEREREQPIREPSEPRRRPGIRSLRRGRDRVGHGLAVAREEHEVLAVGVDGRAARLPDSVGVLGEARALELGGCVGHRVGGRRGDHDDPALGVAARAATRARSCRR